MESWNCMQGMNKMCCDRERCQGGGKHRNASSWRRFSVLFSSLWFIQFYESTSGESGSSNSSPWLTLIVITNIMHPNDTFSFFRPHSSVWVMNLGVHNEIYTENKKKQKKHVTHTHSYFPEKQQHLCLDITEACVWAIMCHKTILTRKTSVKLLNSQLPFGLNDLSSSCGFITQQKQFIRSDELLLHNT